MRDLMKKMPKLVEPGDDWFVYSCEWLHKWQKHVYFELIEQSRPLGDVERPSPGMVDCSAIIEPASKF
jgi:hypothetical protein